MGSLCLSSAFIGWKVSSSPYKKQQVLIVGFEINLNSGRKVDFNTGSLTNLTQRQRQLGIQPLKELQTPLLAGR